MRFISSMVVIITLYLCAFSFWIHFEAKPDPKPVQPAATIDPRPLPPPTDLASFSLARQRLLGFDPEAVSTLDQYMERQIWLHRLGISEATPSTLDAALRQMKDVSPSLDELRRRLFAQTLKVEKDPSSAGLFSPRQRDWYRKVGDGVWVGSTTDFDRNFLSFNVHVRSTNLGPIPVGPIALVVHLQAAPWMTLGCDTQAYNTSRPVQPGQSSSTWCSGKTARNEHGISSFQTQSEIAASAIVADGASSRMEFADTGYGFPGKAREGHGFTGERNRNKAESPDSRQPDIGDPPIAKEPSCQLTRNCSGPIFAQPLPFFLTRIWWLLGLITMIVGLRSSRKEIGAIVLLLLFAALSTLVTERTLGTFVMSVPRAIILLTSGVGIAWAACLLGREAVMDQEVAVKTAIISGVSITFLGALMLFALLIYAWSDLAQF